MVQENEVITLFVSTGGAIFLILNLKALARSVPSWRWLLAAFLSLYSGWALTVLEGLLFPQALNFLEHAAYMLSSLLMAAWAFRTLVAAREDEP